MRRPVLLLVPILFLVPVVALAAAAVPREPVRPIRPLQFVLGDPVAKAPGFGPPAQTVVPAPARPSRALGTPTNGRLRDGVQFPEAGPDWVTWDPVLKRSPNRPWRRWGTDKLVGYVQRILAGFRRHNPGVPRVLVGDLSRPEGGAFDRRYGGLGHASHQNGLDVDIFYVRKDRRELAPRGPGQVDRALAQDLVDRFAHSGARYVFVGPRLGLKRTARSVTTLVHHDDHLHVRIRPRAARR